MIDPDDDRWKTDAGRQIDLPDDIHGIIFSYTGYWYCVQQRISYKPVKDGLYNIFKIRREELWYVRGECERGKKKEYLTNAVRNYDIAYLNWVKNY